MAAGWVYLLVNSSMPGLVKVGKTTRPTSERVAELSGVTGVATPFIVAFEQFFSDCGAAEDFVHAELEQRGMRPSANREFFQAAANDVIRVILAAPGMSEPSQARSAENAPSADSDLISHRENDEFDSRPQPWKDILEQADNHYYGFDEAIQDHQEALKLYIDAARLGSLEAYGRIGDIYNFGEGVKEDSQKALEFYKEGAKRGNYFCYTRMARLYEFEHNIENAKKAWSHFFKQRDKAIRHELEAGDAFAVACGEYVVSFCSHDVGLDFADRLTSLIPATREKIISWVEMRLRNAEERGRTPELKTILKRAAKWAQDNLSEKMEVTNQNQTHSSLEELEKPIAKKDDVRPIPFSKLVRNIFGSH